MSWGESVALPFRAVPTGGMAFESLADTATSNNGVWNKTLASGRGFTFIFRRAGTYRYHCNTHREMTGLGRVT